MAEIKINSVAKRFGKVEALKSIARNSQRGGGLDWRQARRSATPTRARYCDGVSELCCVSSLDRV